MCIARRRDALLSSCGGLNHTAGGQKIALRRATMLLLGFSVGPIQKPLRLRVFSWPACTPLEDGLREPWKAL